LLSLFYFIQNPNVSRTLNRNSSYQLHTNITTATVNLTNVFAKTSKNDLNNTIVTQNASVLSHSFIYRLTWRPMWPSYKETHTDNDWSVMENMTECETCPTALSEWTQLSKWDIRSSAGSRFVLQTYYNFNWLHKYLACFKWNKSFISVIYPVLCFKNGCSRGFVYIYIYI
jgi:hypothetical protein